MTIRHLRWLTLVLTMSLSALQQSASDGLRDSQNLLEIATPSHQELISALPVRVTVRFGGLADKTSFTATLNNEDVTYLFKVSESRAEARLDIQHGIRPSLGSQGQLRAPNILIIRVRSGDGGRWHQEIRHFFVNAPAEQIRTTQAIPTSGGSISIPNYATLLLPSQTFARPQRVRIEISSSAITAEEFSVSSVMFGVTLRLPYEIRINTGESPPLKPLTLVVELPRQFTQIIPDDSEIQIFVQVFQDGGDEILDSFELFSSELLQNGSAIRVALPSNVFTNRRDSSGAFEAIIVVGATPTKPSMAVRMNTSQGRDDARARSEGGDESHLFMNSATIPFIEIDERFAGSQSKCEGSTLLPPLRTLEITSSFNPERRHYGVDYRAPDGTPVYAMQNGIIERVGFDERPLPFPDPRSGKTVKGWGRYIVIKHDDGSKSLYAHLMRSLIREGTRVAAGQEIALSNNTGGSSGPHLHVEYAPNGSLYDVKGKADPHACIGSNVAGSITIRDNGPAADDAFSLTLNGLRVCVTAIGAANSCALGSLRPGYANLVITAIIAPDNVGTYEIVLSDGLKFSDGTTQKTGILPEGGSHAYTIVIPGTPQ